MGAAENLERLLAAGTDTTTLRFALGMEYLKQGQAEHAIRHLSVAVRLDPRYSAAWKLLGRAQAAKGLREDAKASFERGIAVAEGRGDEQAAREMRVFLKRLSEPTDDPPS